MKRKEVSIVLIEGNIWGVFSTLKKADKATQLWKLLGFDEIKVFQINWRIKTAPPKYLSDDNG